MVNEDDGTDMKAPPEEEGGLLPEAEMMSIGFYGRNRLPACFHMAMRHEIQYVGNENGFSSDYDLHIITEKDSLGY